MYKLYGIFFLMLIIATGLLAIPFLKTSRENRIGLVFTTSFIVIFSLFIYQISGNHFALKEWLTKGEQHYDLQVAINKLGGIDGIIKRIKDKLDTNPQDAQGWFILGKLYIDKQDYDSAKTAFERARQLAPDDNDIKHYYDVTHDKR